MKHVGKLIAQILLTFAASLSLFSVGPAIAQQQSAKQIFDQAVQSVFQIRVIDIASGDKYSIGSGFTISDQGHIATNFHVIASFVHEPEKYRLEYIAADKSDGSLELLAVDVVHDLAIVKAASVSSAAFVLNDAELPKGERLYAMGNPHDLGMTIIEGNFNGQVEKSRYRKILFSGSLNAGMSGGPTFNAAGEVVGINVSKGGEQISFLVPSAHLIALHNSLLAGEANTDFQHTIQQDLLEDQQHFYAAMSSASLEYKLLESIQVPTGLHPSLNCWGHSEDDEDKKYTAVHHHCKSEDRIFIKSRLNLGRFLYDVEFIETDAFNRFQFYNLLESRYEHARFGNSGDKDDYHPLNCHDGIVKLASGTWKISSCFREFAKYPELYDSSMIAISTDYPSKAALIRVSMSGISLDNALAVFKRLTQELAWKP